MSNWSSLNNKCCDILLKLSIAFSLTASISSLNISIMKSCDMEANMEERVDNSQMESRAALRTSKSEQDTYFELNYY